MMADFFSSDSICWIFWTMLVCATAGPEHICGYSLHVVYCWHNVGVWSYSLRSIASTLQYVTFTRPHIVYAVQQVCLRMQDPKDPHLGAMKRILRYLQGSKGIWPPSLPDVADWSTLIGPDALVLESLPLAMLSCVGTISSSDLLSAARQYPVQVLRPSITRWPMASLKPWLSQLLGELRYPYVVPSLFIVVTSVQSTSPSTPFKTNALSIWRLTYTLFMNALFANLHKLCFHLFSVLVDWPRPSGSPSVIDAHAHKHERTLTPMNTHSTPMGTSEEPSLTGKSREWWSHHRRLAVDGHVAYHWSIAPLILE